jgi:hypothetical protein
MPVQRRFYLRQFHPVAANLHHAVLAAQIDVVPVRIPGHQVAGPVHKLVVFGPERALDQHLTGFGWLSPVPAHERGAPYIQLADLAWPGNAAAVACHREHVGVGAGLADGNRSGACAAGGYLERRAYVGLGWPVPVEVSGVRQLGHQPGEVLGRKHLPGEDHLPQAGQVKLAQPAIAGEKCQHRRHGIPDRDPFPRQPFRDRHREGGSSVGQDSQAGGSLAGGEDVEDRQVEVERRGTADTVLLGEPRRG